MTDFRERPVPGPNASRQEYEAWLQPLVREYRGTGEESERPSSPDGRELSNHEFSTREFSTRRAEQVQHIAALIRQTKEPRVAVTNLRRYGWWLAAAASTLAFVGASAWFVNSSPLARLDAGTGATPNNPTGIADQAPDSPNTVQKATAGSIALREVAGRVVASHSSGNTELVKSQTSLLVGDEVSTTAEGFLSLEVGLSRVDLAGASTLKLLRVDPRDQVYALGAGRVDLNIPRIPGEVRSIAVQTADSVVSVKGTVFSVEVVDPGDAPKTLVHVTRGVVAVQNAGQEYLVHAGETFSSREHRVSNPSLLPSSQLDTEHAEEVAPLGTSNLAASQRQSSHSTAGVSNTAGLSKEPSKLKHSTTSPRAPRGAHVEKAESPTEATTVSQPTSRLAEQNQLFAQAVEARKRGDTDQARSLLNDLLRRFPNSPLRASALLERNNLK